MVKPVVGSLVVGIQVAAKEQAEHNIVLTVQELRRWVLPQIVDSAGNLVEHPARSLEAIA